MRRIVLTLLVMGLPAWAAAAEQPRTSNKPKEPPVRANPCAIYGAGYVQVEGTSTCVKIGAGITVDVGSRLR
jgi:hypothetical protein